jgi:hypothetical protein
MPYHAAISREPQPYILTYTYIHTHVSRSIPEDLIVNIHTHTHTYIHTWFRPSTYYSLDDIHVYIHVHIHACSHATFQRTLSAHTYAHTYSHTHIQIYVSRNIPEDLIVTYEGKLRVGEDGQPTITGVWENATQGTHGYFACRLEE